MKLKEYLEEKGIDAKDFARSSGLSLQNIYYWMRGTHIPIGPYISIIQRATKGAVKKEDWIKKPEKKKES